jgi:hypothetical protein
MKRQAVLLALIVSAIASPLAETATKSAKKEFAATTTERGVGTGVTEKIAPAGGPPPACRLAYNGKFGIAVMNITTHRKEVAAPEPAPVPVPSQVKPVLASAETTPLPPAAVGPSDEFGAITKQSTRTHTRTVTVRRTVVGQEVKASVYMISQIRDGQVQAPTAHTLLSRTTFGAAAPPPASATPAKPQSTVGSGLVTEIGDGQIQAPKPAAATAAASPKPPAAAPPAAASPAPAPPAAAPPAAAPPAAAPPKAIPPPAAAPPAAADPMAGMDMGPKPAAAAAPAAFPGLGAPPMQEMSGMSGMSGMKEKRQGSPESGTQLVACQVANTLSMTLQDGVLKDAKGRTGYIASNYQFQ